MFEVYSFLCEGLAVLPAAQMTCFMKHAGALCSLSLKLPAMPLGHLHIQWVMLNVQVRILISRIGNAVHVYAHSSESHWMGLLYSPATGPAAHGRWIWCDGLIFDLYVNTVDTACGRVCAKSLPPPLLPWPRKRILLKT